MPVVGLSIDRRTFKLANEHFNDNRIYSLVCFACAQVKTHAGPHHCTKLDYGWCKQDNSEIKYAPVTQLVSWLETDPDAFESTLGLGTFLRRYADGHDRDSGVYANAPGFKADNWDWKQILRRNKDTESKELICCPEDIERCNGTHLGHEICGKCKVPLCLSCLIPLSSGHEIPMALSNDNMWGYATGLIVKHKVRWIEMAAILPYWTCMMVYYVEGDYDMSWKEKLGDQQHDMAHVGIASVSLCRGRIS